MERHALPKRNRTLLLLAIAGALAALPAPASAQPPAIAAPAKPAAPDPLATALAPQPGGLTPEEVGRTVARNKHSVRAKQAELRAAAARVDQALVNFFPKV